jgi:rhodanese-related sulfurtransferase
MEAIIFLVGAGLLSVSCKPGSDMPKSDAQVVSIAEQAAVQNVGVESFSKFMNTSDDYQLIDVRTPGELVEGSIPGATMIDISDFNQFEEGVAQLDKAKPVLVYCKAGGRSARAANYMVENGFAVVYNLEGGIIAWKEAGYEVNTVD